MNDLPIGGVQQGSATPQSSSDPVAQWRNTQVRALMSSPVLCVDELTSVPEAQALMKERNIRRLVVIEDGKLAGIITLGDIRGALPSEVTNLNHAELDYLMQQVKVSRIVQRDVITVKPDASLADAARLMVRYKIGGLPVINDAKQVVGMITESDIFNQVVKLFDAPAAA